MYKCAANVHDCKMAVNTIDVVPLICGKVGHPRKRPQKVVADKGYDSNPLRKEFRRRGVQPHFYKRKQKGGKQEPKENGKLNGKRWKIERTISWLNQNRRLKIRYERHSNIYHAFLLIACAKICIRRLYDHF